MTTISVGEATTTPYLEVDSFQIGWNTVWITCSNAFDSFTYSSSERVIKDISSGLSCQKMKPGNRAIFKNSIDVEQSLKFTLLIWKKFLFLDISWLLTNDSKGRLTFSFLWWGIHKVLDVLNSAPITQKGLGFQYEIKFELIIFIIYKVNRHWKHIMIW